MEDTVFKNLISRFLNLYYLKPMDAVNDAANAFSLLQLPWKQPICEVGTGDGIFSFIMQGGNVSTQDDRYNQCNPALTGDIYHIYRDENRPVITTKVPLERCYSLGIDGNPIHLKKCEDWGLYTKLLQAPSEDFSSVPAESFETVFLYVYHGLKDYAQTLSECSRILKPNGRILFLAYHSTVKENFPCYALSNNETNSYFTKLDNGRQKELSNYSKSTDDWNALFTSLNLEIETAYTQVSPLAWRFYDLQTRPFFKSLLRWDERMRKEGLKEKIKTALLEELAPSVYEFASEFARPRKLKKGDTPDIFLSFSLKKIEGTKV